MYTLRTVLGRFRDVVARPTNDVRTLYRAINRILSLALSVKKPEENPSNDRGVKRQHIADLLTCDTTL